jgi:hypothetical protein
VKQASTKSKLGWDSCLLDWETRWPNKGANKGGRRGDKKALRPTREYIGDNLQAFLTHLWFNKIRLRARGASRA